MKMNKIIGISLLCLLFGGVFASIATESGIEAALQTFLKTAIIVIVAWVAAYFMTADNKP
jgi:flagellar motor component MotA